MTGLLGGVYQDSIRSVPARVCLIVLLSGSLAWAEDLPLTHNVPVPDFQNRTESAKPYNFDAPPEGMFRRIVLAEGFDAPAVRAVYIARPVFAPNRYQQMVGRGLRGPRNGGKGECLIVDVEDNVVNFEEQLAFTQFEYLWTPEEVETVA